MSKSGSAVPTSFGQTIVVRCNKLHTYMESKNHEFLEWMGTKRSPRRPRKIEQEWSPSDVQFLIQLVEQRELLWDPSEPNHKDARMRENAFQIIADALDRTMTDCKAKWDNLRAQYRSYQAKASQNMSVKWQYFESLKFLNQVCEARKTKANLSRVPFIEDMDTCSSLFSSRSRQSTKEEGELTSPDLSLIKARAAQKQIHSSAQIFGDFVADQMRQLNPNLATELKTNILKLVVEALEKNNQILQ